MTTTPQQWIISSLSDVATVNMGQSPDSRSYNEDGRGMPFFQGKAEFGKLYPTVRKWCTDPTKVADAEDILLSIRAPVGPTNLAPDQCCIGRGLAAIRAVDPFDQMYLLYFFRSIEPWLAQQGTGTTFAAISSDFIKTLNVPVAPFNEQKRIVNKLNALLARVDACRERLDRVPQITKLFRQAVLAAATSGALTEEWTGAGSWTTSQLGTLLTDVRYGTAKKSTYDLKDGTPVLRIPNIMNGRVDTTDLKYGYFEKKELESLSLKEGDLLIIRSNGSLDLVGKTAVVGPEVEGYLFAGYLIRLRVKSNLIDPQFLCFCLSSPDTRQHIELTARSTSGVNNINSEEIRSIEIKLPGIDEQLEIVRRVEILFAFADRLEARYNAGREWVDQLVPSLLNKAFSGELTAEWREQNNDLITGENSAEALLARIKAEKAEAVRANNNRKRIKTKTGKNMKPKMIIPVAVALKTAGTPLTAQALLTQSGYPSDATTEDLERFFLDIRDQLKLGAILRERSGDNDIFTLVK